MPPEINFLQSVAIKFAVNSRCYLFLLICLLSTQLLIAQESWEFEVGTAKSFKEPKMMPLGEGFLFFVKQSETRDIILLNNQFEVLKQTTIPAVDDKRVFIGYRETSKNYIIYLDRKAKKSYLEMLYIDKESFQPRIQPFFQTLNGYRQVKEFMLENDFYSITLNRKEGQLKMVRSFGEDEHMVFTYDIGKKDFRKIRSSGKSGLGLGNARTQYTTRAIEKERDYSMFYLQARNKIYLDEEGQLMLTTEESGSSNADLKIFKLNTDPASPGNSELGEKTLGRPMGYKTNSYIHGEYVYSIITSWDLATSQYSMVLNVHSLTDLSKVASFTHTDEIPEKSIKPDSIQVEGTFDINKKRPKLAKGIISKLTKGTPAISVSERGDELVVTIGVYEELIDPSGSNILPVSTTYDLKEALVKIPTYGFLSEAHYSGAKNYYYQVRLEKGSFKSLGMTWTDRTVNQLPEGIADFVLRNDFNENAFYKTRSLFEKDGAFYIAYRPKKSGKYKVTRLKQ